MFGKQHGAVGNKMGQETFYAGSAYMEYNDAIGNSLKKIE